MHVGQMDNNFISKSLVDFLQRQSFGLMLASADTLQNLGYAFTPTHLWTPEIHDQNVDEGQNDKNDVVSPLDIAQRGRCGFHIRKSGEKGSDQRPRHALRADVSWKDLT